MRQHALAIKNLVLRQVNTALDGGGISRESRQVLGAALDEADSVLDVLERVLYNAILHGISLDGTNTYYCNPLSDRDHLRDVV